MLTKCLINLKQSVTSLSSNYFIIEDGYVETTSNSVATPQQKTVICDPNDSYVNPIEAQVCGLPEGPHK
jgi:hypothetical protein